MQQAIENLVQSRTTFVIAHRLSTIRKADRIVVVQDGAIVEEGGIFQNYYICMRPVRTLQMYPVTNPQLAANSRMPPADQFPGVRNRLLTADSSGTSTSEPKKATQQPTIAAHSVICRPRCGPTRTIPA